MKFARTRVTKSWSGQTYVGIEVKLTDRFISDCRL